MLSKGIIFLIIWLLFVSRLIPKYNIYLETNQVQLFGHSWEGQTGLMVLVGIVILGIVVLGISIQNFYLFFTKANDNQD